MDTLLISFLGAGLRFLAAPAKDSRKDALGMGSAVGMARCFFDHAPYPIQRPQLRMVAVRQRALNECAVCIGLELCLYKQYKAFLSSFPECGLMGVGRYSFFKKGQIGHGKWILEYPEK